MYPRLTTNRVNNPHSSARTGWRWALLGALLFCQVVSGSFPESGIAASKAGAGKSSRGRSQLLHGAVKAVNGAAKTITVSGAAAADLKVTLSPRGHALRAGKAVVLGDFHPGDKVAIRGHLVPPDAFTATAVMDEESEHLSRRSPLMKVISVDSATGEVLLQSDGGDIHIRVLRSRIRMGRKELGATTDLSVGQNYDARLSTGPDGQPAISLAVPRTGSARTRKSRSATPSP